MASRSSRKGASRIVDHKEMLASVECIRPLVCEKLKSMDCYLDDELPDYVLTMVANGKAEVNMIKDLSLFMGSLAEVFVDWLQGVVQENVKEDEPAKKPAVKKSSSNVSRGEGSNKPKLASSVSSQVMKSVSATVKPTDVKAVDVEQKGASAAPNQSSTTTTKTPQKPSRRQGGLRLLTLAVAGANADTTKALLDASKSPRQSSGETTSSRTTHVVASRQPVVSHRTETSDAVTELAESHSGSENNTVPVTSTGSRMVRNQVVDRSTVDGETPSNNPQFIVTLNGIPGRPRDFSRNNLSGRLNGNRGQSTPLAVKRNFVERKDFNSVAKKRQVRRCEFWPQCLAGDQCDNIHPYAPCRHFPNCQYGKECLFLHPDCKYGRACWQPDCPFVHRDGTDEVV